jgi:hypothetical protein
MFLVRHRTRPDRSIRPKYFVSAAFSGVARRALHATAPAVLGRSLVTALLVSGCAAELPEDVTSEEPLVPSRSSDPKATAATRTVLANLASFDFTSAAPGDRRIIVGQQDADISNRTSYGSVVVPDIAKVTGQWPALVSYEMSMGYPHATNGFDAAAFRQGRGFLRERVIEQHRRGILSSFVWHIRCPKARPTDNDRYSPWECPFDYNLTELLERKANGQPGRHFREWRAMLDEIAELLWSLKDDRGQLVPVQLRPFHEFNGAWFWWGSFNAPEVFAQVWREMVTYLRDGRGLHSPIWVYSPAGPSETGFTRQYPGDARRVRRRDRVRSLRQRRRALRASIRGRPRRHPIVCARARQDRCGLRSRTKPSLGPPRHHVVHAPARDALVAIVRLRRALAERTLGEVSPRAERRRDRG